MIKLKISLEQFNGRKYDSLEIDIKELNQIDKIYEYLENNMSKDAAIESNKKMWAENSLGNPIHSSDGVRLTKADVAKTAKADVKPWEMTKAEIDALPGQGFQKKSEEKEIDNEDLPWMKDL